MKVDIFVITSRIDRQTGKKIKDNHERQKVQNFIKELELRHKLDNKNVVEKPVFKFSAKSRNIKQSLEHLFQHLNQMDLITSKMQYDEALKLFNVEIRQSGRGHSVVVTDGNGKVIRYPIRLSKFKEQAKFYQKEQQQVEEILKRIRHKDIYRYDSLRSDFLKELLCQIKKKKQNQDPKKKYRVKSKGKRRR